MSRPFTRASIDELEAAFDRKRTEPEFLQKLIDELSHRSTERAGRLKARAVQALGTTPKDNPSSASPSQKAPAATDRAAAPPKPMPPITNSPIAILSAWSALEVLSPPTFQRPEDLASGDRRAVAPLDRGALPWEGKGEKARPSTRLYYQLVLGTMSLEAATAKLMVAFADKRVERPAARGKVILASIQLDRDGRPVEEPTTAVSSFGWGVPRVLSGELEGLGRWQSAESELVDGLDKVIRQFDAEGTLKPLDAPLIRSAFDWLVAKVGLPRDLVSPPSFAIRTYQYFKSPEPPEPLLLNSFFLGDLVLAAEKFRQNTATTNLKRYLGLTSPATRRNLLEDRKALESAIRPSLFSAGRWPGPERKPLVVLQQAAVNLALSELRQSGILAVNGPPGTGKTTLLRDIVAALVTERARGMVGFDDPEKAFLHSGQKLRAGNAWLHLYKVDRRLRGFEMLVVSSNNKAVENVSAELPGISAIADDATGLRYFSTLSDELRTNETWGLVAAVLGNASNRGRFKKIFWWDDDVGLSTYLAAAAGTPRAVTITDEETGKVTTRPPRIVSRERPPRDHQDAMTRWSEARKSFASAVKRSEAVLRDLEAVRVLAEQLPDLAEMEADARRHLEQANSTVDQSAMLLQEANRTLAGARRDRDVASVTLQQHVRSRPSFFARLFRTERYRDWRKSAEKVDADVQRTEEALKDAEVFVDEREARFRQTTSDHASAKATLENVAERRESAVQSVRAARERLRSCFVDASFFEREHADLHRSIPWLDEAGHRVRDEVFIAAMALHKAFIDAAAKPLRHNLGALMNAFSGRSLAGPEKQALIPSLWASLFLVVPVVSTTFASVERMLGKLPPEELGWLLIDEAGQALPQAAVGAIMRTKRAVVVGDPLQIEPIVVLPDTLTDVISRRFGIDPGRFNAPAASVQTLADDATSYVAEFAARQGSRTVGVPLLVHRRCAEPMFSISNAIAYEHLMVNAKAAKRSAIRDLIGPSRWFDVQGAAEEKWCPQEGRYVLEILEQLARAGINPSLYIITPFVIVQDNLRKLIRESGILRDWTDDPWSWTMGRVGTVHVVQGREAEAVVFVLGAPAPQQNGARGWAGGKPNLLNVAVTRAKEALYVIGNRKLWREAGCFRELDRRMPTQ